MSSAPAYLKGIYQSKVQAIIEVHDLCDRWTAVCVDVSAAAGTTISPPPHGLRALVYTTDFELTSCNPT